MNAFLIFCRLICIRIVEVICTVSLGGNCSMMSFSASAPLAGSLSQNAFERFVQGDLIEIGAFGERMARYLHPASRRSMRGWVPADLNELVVTRLHAPSGFSDPTSPIPLEKAF
jgi:hypothetical protein